MDHVHGSGQERKLQNGVLRTPNDSRQGCTGNQPAQHPPSDAQPDAGAEKRAGITGGPCPKCGADKQAAKRQSVGEIGSAEEDALVDTDIHAITDTCSHLIGHAESARRRTKHPSDIVAPAPPLLVAASAARVSDFNECFATIDLTYDSRNRALSARHHQRLSGAVSRSGRSLAATASRARNMRDRTVPMGQFMIWAISS